MLAAQPAAGHRCPVDGFTVTSSSVDCQDQDKGQGRSSGHASSQGSGPVGGHFIRPHQNSSGQFNSRGHHNMYPPLQSHPALGISSQAPMSSFGHGGLPGSGNQRVNGTTGTSGIAQKAPVSAGHGLHPSHMDSTGIQNPRTQVVQNDSHIRMVNGSLHPYPGGGNGGFGIPAGPARPVGSQGSPSRVHRPHEMVGQLSDGVPGRNGKNGDGGYLGPTHLLTQQPSQVPLYSSTLGAKRSEAGSRHLDTPYLDDFAHMGLITDLLE